MGNILVVVEEMVRQETSFTNTSAESQGTCIYIHVAPCVNLLSMISLHQ